MSWKNGIIQTFLFSRPRSFPSLRRTEGTFPPSPTAKDFREVVKTIITQTARLILRERVDFARQQPDRNRQNRAATVESCFVLIGTRQHGVTIILEQDLQNHKIYGDLCLHPSSSTSKDGVFIA